MLRLCKVVRKVRFPSRVCCSADQWTRQSPRITIVTIPVLMLFVLVCQTALARIFSCKLFNSISSFLTAIMVKNHFVKKISEPLKVTRDCLLFTVTTTRLLSKIAAKKSQNLFIWISPGPGTFNFDSCSNRALPSSEYFGFPSSPVLVILASWRYFGPGLQSFVKACRCRNPKDAAGFRCFVKSWPW